MYIHFVVILCAYNICKPREYPVLLKSYVNRKIDLMIIKIKVINKMAVMTETRCPRGQKLGVFFFHVECLKCENE